MLLSSQLPLGPLVALVGVVPEVCWALAGLVVCLAVCLVVCLVGVLGVSLVPSPVVERRVLAAVAL